MLDNVKEKSFGIGKNAEEVIEIKPNL